MPTKIDFIGGNTKRCLMAMALPMMAAMFLNMMYNLVDSLWIGNLLGETAYAALTNSTPVILLLTSVAMGATNGVSILLSQVIGAKDRIKTEGLIATSFCAAVVFSLLVTALLEIFLPGILKALNTPEETYDMAYGYLAIYVLGYFAVYLYLYFTAVLRSFGNSMFQAAAMLVSTILNAVLDPIFIHFIGFHGAAIATLLSQAICLLFMLIYLKKKKLFKFKISAFDKKEVWPLVQKAIPSVIQQSIPAISTTFLTALVSTYSVTAIAAYGVTGKLETILFYPAMALNMVLTAIIGQCIGAGSLEQVKYYTKKLMKITYFATAILIIAIFATLPLTFRIYHNISAQALELAAILVLIHNGCALLIWPLSFTLPNVLKASNDVRFTMVVSIFSMWMFRIVFSFIIGSWLGLGAIGVWIAMVMDWIFRAACFIWRYLSGKWKKYSGVPQEHKRMDTP